MLKDINNELRFSRNSIIDQVNVKLKRTMYKALIGVCRQLLGEQTQAVDSMQVIQEVYARQQKEGALEVDEQQVTNIMYKKLIQEGLLTIKVVMNSMDERDWLLKTKDWVMNKWGTKSPWGSRYHLWFLIGDVFYSYTNNGQIRQNLFHHFDPRIKFQYVLLDILQFHPLHNWVHLLAQALYQQFSTII